MCQASPGPRCFNDSNKRMAKLNAKLEKTQADLDVARKGLDDAAKASNFNAYSKAKKQVTLLEKKVEQVSTDIRHTQRDIDSTLTGRKAIEKAMASASTKSELNALDIRRRTAEALRFNREHALALKENGQVPAIRFAS